MNHRYIEKLARLYESDNAQTPEGQAAIGKLETQAVAHYITDVANAVGINRNMIDLPIVIAALRAQSNYLMNMIDDDRKKYVEHLEKQMSGMSVCSIEIDVAELIKQIREQKNNMHPGDVLPEKYPEVNDTDGEP